MPADTRRTLSGIVAQLRNVPRPIIGDPAEVVHFLGRTARALERLRDQPATAALALSAPAPRPAGPLPAQAPSPRILSARERAEAAFKPPSGPAIPPTDQPTAAPIILSALRTVTDRKGRGVRVEVRRARAAGQMEMPI